MASKRVTEVVTVTVKRDELVGALRLAGIFVDPASILNTVRDGITFTSTREDIFAEPTTKTQPPPALEDVDIPF